MILPLAVVERWPMEEYKHQHNNDLVAALKHANQDAVNLHYELEFLRSQFRQSDSKDDKRFNKQLDLEIRDKEERMFRMVKFNDYAAMIMASYPEAKFITSYDYKRKRNNITDPILIRGISSGAHAKHAIEHNRDFYFVETGYLGNYRSDKNTTGRKVYHRIEKNDMQQNRIMDVPDDRWRALCSFNPTLNYRGWKKPGSKILLVMSTEKPFEYYDQSREQWIQETVSTLKKHTDRKIVVRDKASRGERTNNTIYDALDDDIYALVTYNSIAAVEAIHHGIPAFCSAPTAASAVTTGDLTQIESPPRLDETVIYKWLSSIAYGQFNLTEILTGEAWKLVQENATRSTFNY